MEKIFTNPTSDEALVSSIYKDLKKLNNKARNPVTIWAKGMNGQGWNSNGQKRHEKMLRICRVQENFTPVRMTIIQQQQ